MEGIIAVALRRAIGGASGPQIDHRRARKACPFVRSRRESGRGSKPGTGSKTGPAHPAGGRRGPPRAGGRTAQRADESGAACGRRGHDRESPNRENSRGSSHGEPGRRESSSNRPSSTAPRADRGKPGTGSQKHRDADKRTNRESRHTTSRETTDKRTRAATITTGRETPTPRDRESTTATAGSPQRTGATPSPGLRVGAPSSCERQPEDRRPGNQALMASETASGKHRPHATGGRARPG